MGTTSSKLEKDEPLRLCRERKRFIKLAIDSRYDLAASHVAYTNSLKNIGAALRRYAEAENLIDPLSAGEVGKTTPLHSSYHPSPSPVHNVEVLEGSTVGDTAATTTTSTVNCMRSDGRVAVSMRFSPAMTGFLDEENLGFSMPPPPPPLPEIGSSWDYFDTSHNIRRFDINADDENIGSKQLSESRMSVDNEKVVVLRHEDESLGLAGRSAISNVTYGNVSGLEQGETEGDQVEDLLREREDPSEFITHRAKDFLSSIKDIEHRFFRASEAGREVSRLLEANKIRVGYAEVKGSSASSFLGSFGAVCCRGRTSLVSNEPSQGKVITWNRTTSWRSSSSKNPLTTGLKDENNDSGSEFGEDFCMFAGSHSSTLERIFAWERKLYDEVKASEIIMKQYDKRGHMLMRQFAKDVNSHVIDKTRAAIKDLHSRIRVALHTCNSISKRIEKMRDEELLPQLVELVQGLTRMWKAMLECHHAQYITISLAYHKKSTTETPLNDNRHEILAQLRDEVECFGLSFTNWINSHSSYVEALKGYVQNCIMLPQERSKGRRAFSPRRVLAPPIFVLIRDWSVGVQSLPVSELRDSIKHFLTGIDQVMKQQDKEEQKKQKVPESSNIAENNKDKGELQSSSIPISSSSKFIESCLAKVFDKLIKFSEASVKMFEEARQRSEAARVAYTNFRQVHHWITDLCEDLSEPVEESIASF